MHFYSVGYEELRNLPIYTFWELVKNIDRIRAEEDLRQVFILSNTIMTDPKDFVAGLQKQQGKVFEIEESEDFDKTAFNNLRAMLSRK